MAKALLAGWYDACVGLLPSPERLNSFNFTLPFTPNTRAALHYRYARIEGSAKNLTGRKLGENTVHQGIVMRGHATLAACSF